MALIGIDARKYFDFGIGTYLQHLIRSLQAIPSSHRYWVYAAAGDVERFDLQEGWQVTPVGYPKYSVEEFLFFGRRAVKDGVDIFHTPHYTLPSGLRGRSVVTIQDLIHLHFSQYFNSLQRAYAAWMIRSAVVNAAAIIVPSLRTKEDIVERYPGNEEKIHVIHHGIDSAFRRVEDVEQIKAFREGHGLRGPFILYVGGLKSHKNIPVLLRGFALLRREMKEVELAFVGETFADQPGLVKQAAALEILPYIHDVGRVDTRSLRLAYSAADALVLPSLYEGFGFTPLEAMACGTPAVVSDAGSIPEVVGDAALVYPAREAESLASALKAVLTDENARNTLIARGFERARSFTWDACARKTSAVYEHILTQQRSR
jgi:glycosyltransferase involved in cell wall biosynthesis